MNRRILTILILTALWGVTFAPLQASACENHGQQIQSQKNPFQFSTLTEFVNKKNPGYNYALDTAKEGIESGTYRLWGSINADGPWIEVMNEQGYNYHSVENGNTVLLKFPKLRLQRVK